MVNHVQRFRLGVTLLMLGLTVTVIGGGFWVQHGGLQYGLPTLLGIVLLAYGGRLLRHKRSL
ncbi:hypothetical protein [Deinococcus sp. UYEF24]